MSTLNGTAGRYRFVEPADVEALEDAKLGDAIHQEIVQPPTVYKRIQIALGDYRKQRGALETVLNLVANENVVPIEVLDRTVSEQIERRLVQQVGMVVRDKAFALRSVHNA